MDGCDGHGGLDGLDMGHGSVAGLCGFSDHGWDGSMHSIDLLEGGSRRQSVDASVRAEPQSGVAALEEGNLYAVRVVRHGDADLQGILKEAAERAGLLKVAPILVGQKELNETAYSILPVNACLGAKKGDMPVGYSAGMTGKTVMFRLFYQIPKRAWGIFSAPVRDKDAGVYLDISGMTWTMNDGSGDSQTQLLIRVVPMTVLDSRSKQWCQCTTNVQAHRKVGQALSLTMYRIVSHHAPADAKADRLSRMSAGGKTVTPRPAAPAPRAEVAQPRPRRPLAGVDLWSALVGSPQLNAVHAASAGIPSSGYSMPYTEPVLESETVTVRVALPRRTSATV